MHQLNTKIIIYKIYKLIIVPMADKRTVHNTLLLFISYPIYAILLYHPKRTKTMTNLDNYLEEKFLHYLKINQNNPTLVSIIQND